MSNLKNNLALQCIALGLLVPISSSAQSAGSARSAGLGVTAKTAVSSKSLAASRASATSAGSTGSATFVKSTSAATLGASTKSTASGNSKASSSSAVSSPTKQFEIEVSWPNGDGKQLTLTTNKNGVNVTLDSARIVKGAAVLKMTAPELYSPVYVGINQAYVQELLAYDGKVNLDINNTSESDLNSTVTVKGSLEQDLFQEYSKIFMTGLQANFNRMQATKAAGDDTQKKDSIKQSYRPLFDSLLHAQDYIATKYPDKDIAGFMLAKRAPSLSVEEREREYKSLSDRVKRGPYGIAARGIITSIIQRQVGQPAFKFSATTKDKKVIKLADYKGKYVLLDFWSSTCIPCLRMAPYVKQLYDTYRDKGFEIIAISLDNKRADWIAALQKHAISGIQVSSLKGGDDPIAEYYGVEQMPAMILIDREGNNAGAVDPTKLDQKLAQIFNNK